MSAENKIEEKTMKKQLVKWKGPKVDIGIGRRREPDSNVWVNNDDDGEDNPDDWEDDTPGETDGWSSDNSENGTPGVEELVSGNDDAYTYDSDDSDEWELDFGDMDPVPNPNPTFEELLARVSPDSTPSGSPVPDKQPTLEDILSTIPDDFELRVTPEMMRASRDKRQRRNEDIERTRMSTEDRNSAGESKNSEEKSDVDTRSKNSEEKSNVDTRPNRMRNLRLRF